MHLHVICKGSQLESNKSTMSFINKLNNVGLRLQPCLTTIRGWKKKLSPLLTLTAETTLSYLFFNKNIIFWEIPIGPHWEGNSVLCDSPFIICDHSLHRNNTVSILVCINKYTKLKAWANYFIAFLVKLKKTLRSSRIELSVRKQFWFEKKRLFCRLVTIWKQ